MRSTWIALALAFLGQMKSSMRRLGLLGLACGAVWSLPTQNHFLDSLDDGVIAPTQLERHGQLADNLASCGEKAQAMARKCSPMDGEAPCARTHRTESGPTHTSTAVRR